MDDSTQHQHQHYGSHQNIMQANQQIGQQPPTFNPMEHFWFANLSPPEEKQQSQTDVESPSFSLAGTLLPSPADLDIDTSPTYLLDTMYQLNRNLNQQLEDLNQKFEEMKRETARVSGEGVRVTGNHEELLSWTFGVNDALKSMGQRVVKLDADLKTVRGRQSEIMSRVDEVQEE
ncbi:hypothetical protein VE00_07890 [Pseudogymnoascus sp. WSF 3629]|nr:hypothetical protein VE00_07890 [Pseudogymnoascus sp. WSF 3629]